MPTQIIESIIQQTDQLTAQEKMQLAHLLLEKAKPSLTPHSSNGDSQNKENKQDRQLQWLKTHRDEYAGQYVALDGDQLVVTGKTIMIAREQAKKKGVLNPFLVRLTSEKDVQFGGW